METPETATTHDPQPAIAPPPKVRPPSTVLRLRPEEPAWPGDVLITLVGSTDRVSVRPGPKCTFCRTDHGPVGWVRVAEDDGSRFGLRVPNPCACIMDAIKRAGAKTPEVATMTVSDPGIGLWRRELSANIADTDGLIATLGRERDAKIAELEAEAARLTTEAKARPEVAPDDLPVVDALAEAREHARNSAEAVKHLEQALETARTAREVAWIKLEGLEAAERTRQARTLRDLNAAAELTLTANHLKSDASGYADKLKRLEARSKRLRRELAAAIAVAAE